MKHMKAVNYADLAKLQREFEAADAHGDREAVRALNYRFHSHLYALARLPQTLHFAQVLWAKYPFDLINLIDGRAGRAATEHRNLLKTMKAGDKKAVVNAVREHIEAGWQELQKNLERQAARKPASGARKRTTRTPG
jgi:DNA-binding GntR family transcriptional regulator